MKTLCTALMVGVLMIQAARSFRLSFPGGLGPCPSPPVQANFSVARYQGVWYEYQRFFTPVEALVTCGQATYRLMTNNTLAVNNTGIRTVTVGGRTVYRKRTFAEGEAYIPDLNVSAKLVVEFDKIWIPSFLTRGMYWVLSTDYTTYSLVYSCTAMPFNLAHLDGAWILTRERGVAPGNLQALRERLRAGGVDPDNFFTVPQDHCYLQPTSELHPYVARSPQVRIN